MFYDWLHRGQSFVLQSREKKAVLVKRFDFYKMCGVLLCYVVFYDWLLWIFWLVATVEFGWDISRQTEKLTFLFP